MTEPVRENPLPTVETVEAMVRRQMSTALGGPRGMLEAGIPGIVFTVMWLVGRNLTAALVVSLAIAAIALVARLVQRGSTQYVFNAVFGIGLGWLFVYLAARGGGSEEEQALAFFLPGIIYSAVYTVVFGSSCLVGWPFLGFMLGSVTGDLTSWRRDKQVVRLCTRLTLLLLLPGALNSLMQGAVWIAAQTGALDVDVAILTLGILRAGVGWAIRIASWSAMIWLLARNATPLERPEPAAG